MAGLNKVRIIGGKWRGKKISFPDAPGLRPTPDRVRETLFNWLRPIIHDARCLDLFAGSGALGLEALSQGASFVTFVDASRDVCQHIQKNIDELKTTQTQVVNQSVISSLELSQGPYNIIFLDPPFNQDLIEPTCQWLIDKQLLSSDSLIYIEAEKNLNPLPLPEGWEVTKSKTAGDVCYHLVRA